MPRPEYSTHSNKVNITALYSKGNISSGVTANIISNVVPHDGPTTMYMVKDDVCNEVQVTSDSIDSIDSISAHVLVAGSCAHNGWTVKEQTYYMDVNVGNGVILLPVTQWYHAGLMNLCDGSNCNKMGMVILLI